MKLGALITRASERLATQFDKEYSLVVKQIETLVEDINNLFTGEGITEDVSALFTEFGAATAAIMARRFVSDPEGAPQAPRLRMSNIGRPDRQLWYELNLPKDQKEQFQAHTLVKFAYGDLVEQQVLLYARLAGHTVEGLQQEVELNDIKGSIDAIIDGVVVDVKSASSFSFQKFKSGSLFEEGQDPFGYVAQLCGYTKALGKERCGFLAVDKTLGHICFLEIPQEIINSYDVESRIEHVKEVVKLPETPPRCHADVPHGKSGNMKLGTACSYCAFKETCWPEAKPYYYASGPIWLTKVAKEPKVNDFA